MGITLGMTEWYLWHLDEESHKQHEMLYIVKIVDLDGLGKEGRKVPIFVPKFKTFLFGILHMLQKPYCEHDAAILIVNAPFVFRLVWGMVSLILTEKQKTKFILLGHTSDPNVKAKLLRLVPKSILPVQLGGDLHENAEAAAVGEQEVLAREALSK